MVAVEQEQVFGTAEALDEALSESSASQSVNTSFVERHHGTDRSRNARKSRKTYQFSKDWEIHEAMTYFTMYSYNFCWEVRTLRSAQGGGWLAASDASDGGGTVGSRLVPQGMARLPSLPVNLGHHLRFPKFLFAFRLTGRSNMAWNRHAREGRGGMRLSWPRLCGNPA